MYDYPVNSSSKVHLTEKPVPLLRDLMSVTSDNALILDPFVGSGTTAVAALETGRDCIGIELSTAYADIARERCRKTRESLEARQDRREPPGGCGDAARGEPVFRRG
jgi:site-specific DNA-methyltransferase (adenine-specific)